MKIRILSSLLFVAIIGFVFHSCSDSFLDTPPQGTLDEQTLASGTAGVETSLISAYKSLHGWTANWAVSPWGTNPSNSLFGSMTSDDAYTGTEPTDGVDQRQMELYQWTSSNPNINPKFMALYEGIARANATIKLAAGLDDADEAQRIQGEATFLRAHFHFDAWKMWKNIPYYTEADVDFRKPNNVDALPLIIADLRSAIDLLPETQPEVGRVDKIKARAYLGRVLLYAEDYSAAKTELDAVVNSGRFSLFDCFHKNFLESEENGVESVFAIQFSVNDGAPDGDNANFANRLNMPHGGSPFGCCGFHQPSQNLVNAFKTDANGLPMFDTFNDSDLDPTADNVDPRLDWTVARPDVPALNYGVYTDAWVRAASYAGPYSDKKSIYPDGAAFQSGTWSGTQLHGANYNLIRYADVLLMLAECEAQLNNLSAALSLVNEVRTRAANCAQGPDAGNYISTPNDAGITWATYNIGTYSAFADQAEAMRAVKWERRLELALEGWRWFDLVRWGELESTMNDYFAVEGTKRDFISNASPVVEAKHNLYPLPNTQVQLSAVDGTPQIQQNPGY